MIILGIESSCDETACSLVKNGRIVLSNVIASQVDLHEKTGGVVPEVAAREHVLKMIPVLDEALNTARLEWNEIDAVAVTAGPGLVSSLMIGTQTASAISCAKNKPLIPVHHVVGHLYSNWLETKANEVRLPALILTVSGGHNELILFKNHGEIEVLGETLDDAAGEAFDKVARLLGLGYPGGPILSARAQKGNAEKFTLPLPLMGKKNLDFSFSGLKTAVWQIVEARKPLSSSFINDLCACFEKVVVATLLLKMERAIDACRERGIALQELHLAGGVSANGRLRAEFKEKFQDNFQLRYPKKTAYCTDNAAMIAGAGYFLYRKNPHLYLSASSIVPDPALTFQNV